MNIRLHKEDPGLFREAIGFTAAETGFLPRLIEKDYFCSVLLQDLMAVAAPLTFKGGTLLAKVHAGYYRLSEDLDFTLSTAPEATKKARSQSVAPIKAAIERLNDRIDGFRLEMPLSGFNSSTQYNAEVSYPSALAEQRETIRIEIGVREPTMTQIHAGQARTLLLNPVRGAPLIPTFPVTGLSYQETMAEKMRAALCRRDVAIRDFFDIDYAVRNAGWQAQAPELLELLRRKLTIEGTGPVNVSRERFQQLTAQMEAQLRPVLRSRDFEQFDLNRAFDTVATVAHAVGQAPA